MIDDLSYFSDFLTNHNHENKTYKIYLKKIKKFFFQKIESCLEISCLKNI